MSLTFIALIGILAGFLCLIIGFFLEDAKEAGLAGASKEKHARTLKKKIIVPRRKAA